MNEQCGRGTSSYCTVGGRGSKGFVANAPQRSSRPQPAPDAAARSVHAAGAAGGSAVAGQRRLVELLLYLSVGGVEGSGGRGVTAAAGAPARPLLRHTRVVRRGAEQAPVARNCTSCTALPLPLLGDAPYSGTPAPRSLECPAAQRCQSPCALLGWMGQGGAAGRRQHQSGWVSRTPACCACRRPAPPGTQPPPSRGPPSPQRARAARLHCTRPPSHRC